MKTVEKYWKSQAIIYEFTKFTRASLYAKPSNWQDFNEVNEFCDVFWQIYLSLYLSLSFSRFLQYLFLFSTLTRSLPHPHPSSTTQIYTHTLLCSKRSFQTSYIQLYCIEFDSIEIPTQTKASIRFKQIRACYFCITNHILFQLQSDLSVIMYSRIKSNNTAITIA